VKEREGKEEVTIMAERTKRLFSSPVTSLVGQQTDQTAKRIGQSSAGWVSLGRKTSLGSSVTLGAGKNLKALEKSLHRRNDCGRDGRGTKVI